MTIIVSGTTFNYREALKDMGGKFDGDARRWIFPDTLPERHIATIRRMVGVVIRIPQTAQETAQPVATRDGKTYERGDDMTYLNYFAEKNPVSFFGFSSLSALTDYIEAIPKSVADDDRRNMAWTMTNNFAGTSTVGQAIKLARNGWTDGVEKAKEIAECITSEYAMQRKRVHSVAGSRASVGRMLVGDPKHMMKRAPQPGKRIITLFVETAINVSISAKNAVIRAASIAAIIDLIEQSGFSCELIATNIATTRGMPVQQLAVKIKNAGERLSINDAIFALGHPSFERRFNFALVGSDQQLQMIWSSMGSSSSAFTDAYKPSKNEFYIPQFNYAQQTQIEGETLQEKALSLLPFLIPDGLPITFSNHR